MTERVKKRIPVSWGTGLPWRVKSAFIFHLHPWGASGELEEIHVCLCFAHQWHCVAVLFWSKGVHVDVLALDLQDSLTVRYSWFLPAVTDCAQDLLTPSRVDRTALSRVYYEVVIQSPRDGSESPLMHRALWVLPPHCHGWRREHPEKWQDQVWGLCCGVCVHVCV